MKSKAVNRGNWILIAGGIILLVAGLIIVRNVFSTTENLECVPAPGCHPTSCVDKSTTPQNSGNDLFCTEECVPGTLDCGQGSCQAINGKCEVKWTNQIN